jgi:MFS family permease
MEQKRALAGPLIALLGASEMRFRIGRIPSLCLLMISEVAAMSTWFATNVSSGAIKSHWQLTKFHESLLTSSVQAGFVAGTLLSALLALPDRIDLRRLFQWSAFIAGGSTFSVILFEPTSPYVSILRFATGFGLAGVYPVGVAIVSTWASGDLGLLISLLVAALTFGSALPHLAAASAGVDWRTPCIVTGIAALVAGTAIRYVDLGPSEWKAPKLKFSNLLQAWNKRSLRLANLGYFGHMWELYAMWSWIGAFISASLRVRYGNSPPVDAEIATFYIIVAGAFGAFAGGWASDRIGRTMVTGLSMLVSGSCAVLIGLNFGGSASVILTIGLVWGISIIADSAQFSAAVAELSDGSLRGTMLTIQTSVGFLVTLFSIHLVPYAVDLVGWRYAFSILAIGPLLGTASMLALRRAPESLALADGRR